MTARHSPKLLKALAAAAQNLSERPEQMRGPFRSDALLRALERKPE
jgi:hypothetical protein